MIEPGGQAPYAPSATVISIIERYRNRGLDRPITLNVITRAGSSDALAPRVLKTLKLLDLVTETGEPTAQFEEVAKAPEDQWKERFASVLRAAYADAFKYADPAQDPPERVRDAFRHYEPRGQQERMVALFLGLSQFAGIAPAGTVRKRGTNVKRRDANGRKPQPPKEPIVRKDELPAGHNPVVQQERADVHPFLVGMLRALPPIPADWPNSKATFPKEAREAWTEAALANFNLLYELAPEDEKRGGSG